LKCPNCGIVFYKGKNCLGSAPFDHGVKQYGGRPGGGAAGLPGPVWPPDPSLLAASGRDRVVGPADHPEGGLPSLQGGLPIPG